MNMIHDLEAHGVIGPALLDGDVALEIRASGLRPEHFSSPALGKVWAAILAMLDAGQEATLVGVADSLRRRGDLDEIGGAVALAGIEQGTLSPYAGPDNARLVIEDARRRRLADAGLKLSIEAKDATASVSVLYEAHKKGLDGILADASQDDGVSLFNAGETAIEQARLARENGAAGVRSGFASLDQLTGGFKPGSLGVLAARPSLGKTAIALNIATFAATRGGVGVAFISLEMGADELGMRVLCRIAKLDLARISSGFATPGELALLAEKNAELKASPLTIFDEASRLDRVLGIARREALRRDVGLIVIDYLQLISGPRDRNSNRTEEVGAIARALKLLAKELHVPVLALAQLSRAVEQRGAGKTSARPMLSDLRESGSIEQDADVVMFLHDPAPPGDRRPDIGLLELIVAKNRGGRLGTVNLAFNRPTQAFSEAVRDAARPP